MARYEEERYGGQRGSARRGEFGEHRDEEDLEQQERDRYRASEYGGPWDSERSRGARNEGSWRNREQDYGRSLGGRRYEGRDFNPSQGFGFSPEPDEMQLGRRQG